MDIQKSIVYLSFWYNYKFDIIFNYIIWRVELIPDWVNIQMCKIWFIEIIHAYSLQARIRSRFYLFKSIR